MRPAARPPRHRPRFGARRRPLAGASSADLRDALERWLVPALAATAGLALYILGHLDVIDTTPALAIDAFLLLAIVLYFPMRYVHRLDTRGRLSALLFAVAWLATVYYPIYRRIYPGQRLVTVEATPDALPITLATAGRGTALDLVIDGHLEPPEPGATRVARYALTIEAGGGPPQAVSGEFRESWERQRQDRREAVDVLTERISRVEQIDNPTNGDLRVLALEVSGQRAPLLTLSVYRHELPSWWIALPVGGLLLLGAVLFDRATGAGNTAASLAVATGTAVTGSFTFPSIGSPHPTFRELAGAAIVGGLLGGPIGGLAGWTFRRRFGAPARAARTKTRGR